jgi:hypothetical protein
MIGGVLRCDAGDPTLNFRSLTNDLSIRCLLQLTSTNGELDCDDSDRVEEARLGNVGSPEHE